MFVFNRPRFLQVRNPSNAKATARRTVQVCEFWLQVCGVSYLAPSLTCLSLSLSFFFLLDLSIHLCKYSPLNLPQVLYRPMIPKAGPDLPRLNTCMFSESMCWIPRFTSLLNSLTIQWIPCIPEVPESICSFVYSFRVFIFLGFPRFLRQSAIQCTTLWNEAY